MHSDGRRLPHLIWGMWNSLAMWETVYLNIFMNVSCPLSDISWKFHENLFKSFSVMLLTKTNPNLQRWKYNLCHSAEGIMIYLQCNRQTNVPENNLLWFLELSVGFITHLFTKYMVSVQLFKDDIIDQELIITMIYAISRIPSHHCVLVVFFFLFSFQGVN